MDTKKALSTITAGVLSVAMCGTFASLDSFENTTDVEAVTNMTAMELVDDMGQGWNLGNTFDSTNTWTNPLTVNDIETAWGNPTTTQEMISTIHDYGFNTVRIPITWWQMLDDDYTINEEYLARVKEVVDWCREENMYVIINTHHDDLSTAGNNWLSVASSDITTAQKNYATVWTQIANYFADYDNHLVFEGMNEPDFGTAKVVALNQTFVDTVRATGGNNANRLLLVSAPNTDLDKSCEDAFTTPDDDMIAVSVHYYLPSTFCVYPETDNWTYDWDGKTYVIEHKNEWGSDEDLADLTTNFEKLKSKFMDNGIPVILGEYGVVTGESAGKDHDSIVNFLKTVASTAQSYEGITSVLWDSGNGGDMQYFDRTNLTFFDSEIGDVYLEVNDSDYEPPVQTVENYVETTVDSDNYIAINGSTKVKIEVKGTPNSYASGVLGYYVDATGTWVQSEEDGYTPMTWGCDIGADGTGTAIIDVPQDVTITKAQYACYYSAYWDNNLSEMVDTDSATLTNAYILSDEPVTTTTTTTTSGLDLDTPDYENLFGYVFPLFDNGVVSQWENDGSLADPVAITGNGSYTLTINIPKDGAASAIEFFALSSDINSYQVYNNSKIFKDMTLTIDSILVDGVEIQYVASDDALGMENDGKCYRMSIYDTWTARNIQNINPNVANTESVVVNFTIGGIVGGGDGDTVTTTTTTTTTSTTTTISEAETTTTSVSTEDKTVNKTGTITEIDGSNITIDFGSETKTVSLDDIKDSDTDYASLLNVGDTVSVKLNGDTLVSLSVVPLPDVTTTAVSTVTTTSGEVETTVVAGDTALGDVNMDGNIRVNDIQVVRQWLLHTIATPESTEQAFINADVTKDSTVRVNDIQRIRQYVLHIIDSLDE